MLLEQNVKLKWNNNIKTYYESKGYAYTGRGSELIVNVKDLPLNSHAKIQYKCDYCGDTFETSYIVYNRKEKHNQTILKDCCKSCTSKKRSEVFKEKYGVEHVLQNKDIHNKMKQTNLKKYGVENAFQNKDIQDKMKQTMIKKYGVDHNMKLEETKEKIKATNLKRYNKNCFLQTKNIREKVKQNNLKKYGVECALQSDEVKEKIKQNNLKKYGYEYPTQNKDEMQKILKKINTTMYKNQTMTCSKQQKYLHNLLGGELNYPVDNCMLDIAFPNEKIYIEYDGGGHDLRIKFGMDENDFKHKERKRQYYLKSLGWKLIRIISNKDLLPDDDSIIELIQTAKQLINQKGSWCIINIDENYILNSEMKNKLNLNSLRKIKGDF